MLIPPRDTGLTAQDMLLALKQGGMSNVTEAEELYTKEAWAAAGRLLAIPFKFLGKKLFSKFAQRGLLRTARNQFKHIGHANKFKKLMAKSLRLPHGSAEYTKAMEAAAKAGRQSARYRTLARQGGVAGRTLGRVARPTFVPKALMGGLTTYGIGSGLSADSNLQNYRAGLNNYYMNRGY